MESIVLGRRQQPADIRRERKMSERQFVNYYRCPKDSEEWANVWSSGCNDQCPKCGTQDIEPYKSSEVVHSKPKKPA
jgi:predicted RNA-binding Zn-ribbon protein involved in translation (DUF1610 family)